MFAAPGSATTQPAFQSPAISGLVDCDAINPGSQVRLAPESTDTLEGPQKRFLRQVPSLFAILSQAEEQSKNLRGAFRNQLLESCSVTSL